MKKILITGKNSYVGNSFEKWVENYPEEYKIDKISLKDNSWKNHDFSGYDAVLHVAGIAHVSTDPNMEDLYYKVNRDLTIEVAKKTKNSGVKQFVFMSSIIVYGDGSKDSKIIDRDTIPTPSNFYGKSKLEAEEGIKLLESDEFKVAIIRPPMIYGKNSKGNYPKLSKVAQKLPLFPNMNNKRSMLHIDNLSEFLRLMIDNEESGLFFPQNKEYVITSEMVKLIAETHGKKIHLTKLFNPLLKLMSGRISTIDKVFGNLVYEKKLSEYKRRGYQTRNLKESIIATELNNNDKNIEILIVTDNGLETVGGEQESTKIIINGVHTTFNLGVIQPGLLKSKVSGVEYYDITAKTRIKHFIKNPVSFIRYILKVRKIIATKKPEVIHTQAQVSFFIVSLLRKFKLIPGKFKFIHTERGLYISYSTFFKKVFLFFMRELDTLVTTTGFNLNYWKKVLTERNISLNYKIIENTAGSLFEEYDINMGNRDNDMFVIGFAGRYSEQKNWPLAIDIIEKVNKKLGDNLHIVMAVGCLDDKAEKDTKEMFKKLNQLLGKRFTGKINIDLDEMNKLYYGLDVFILTSKSNSESFGRTLVEAMSRKTVVLTTDAGGPVEVVGDTNNVCDSADEFTKRIMKYYLDHRLMNDEKENNLIRVRQKYSLGNNIEKHMQLYNSSIVKKDI